MGTGEQPDFQIEYNGSMHSQVNYSIEAWGEDHPRRAEFVECLQAAAPEQIPFVQGSYFQSFPCYGLAALQENQVVGLLQFALLPIGAEVNCPPLSLNGQTLVEAKIHAFAVLPAFRNQGIGTTLQKRAILLAKQLGCYQLASYSSYGRDANYQIKLSLGFAAQPEVHGNQEKGIYFIMPLNNLHAADEEMG